MTDELAAPLTAHPWYDIARDLWAWMYGGNVPRVHAEIGRLHNDLMTEWERPESQSPLPAEVPAARTIYRWAERDNWQAWRDRLFVQTLPGMHRANMIDLAAGSREAFQSMREIGRGEHRKGETALQERNRLQANIAFTDRTGYSTRHRAAGEHTPDLAELAQNVSLSPESIAQIIMGALPAHVDDDDDPTDPTDPEAIPTDPTLIQISLDHVLDPAPNHVLDPAPNTQSNRTQQDDDAW